MSIDDARPASFRPDDPQRVLAEALRYLSGAGRQRSPAELLDDLHRRFRLAGQKTLADLVYEMLRACLAAFPDYAQRAYQEVRPRPPEVIGSELGTMNDCLQGVGARTDLGELARARPGASAALADTARCLALLARLEGRSGRQQLATALHHVHAGRPLEAEPILRALAAPTGPEPRLRWYATANLAFCLHRADRSEQAIPFAQAALAERPEIPTPWFNLLSCAAEAGQRALFERSLRRFGALYRKTREPLMRSWLAGERAVLARQTGLSPEAIDALAALDAPVEQAAGDEPGAASAEGAP